MKFDRREMLLSGPAALFGFQLLEALDAQGQTMTPMGAKPTAPMDNKVVDFWVHGMGVPYNTIPGAQQTRGRQPSGPSVSDYGREPMFLHHDEKNDVLLTPDQITADALPASGNPTVNFQLVRMRLNDTDNVKFKDYASGGIYVDLAQTTPQQSVWGDVETLASSVFSAIFPGGGGNGGSSGGGKKGGGKGSGGKGGKFFLPPQAATAQSAGGSAVPLQQPKQATSITLPNGAGRTSFACFAKDRKKTLFGKFIDVFGELAASPMLSYLPMLSLPAVGASTLNAVRSLVANLQAHGENQQWIMMSAPTDVAATQAAVQSSPGALKLPPGNYVLIPKEQSDAMKNQLDKLKIMDGFLVPKGTKALEVYDAYPTAAPGVTYITVSVGVQAQAKSKAG